jgi:hypothetical protein
MDDVPAAASESDGEFSRALLMKQLQGACVAILFRSRWRRPQIADWLRVGGSGVDVGMHEDFLEVLLGAILARTVDGEMDTAPCASVSQRACCEMDFFMALREVYRAHEGPQWHPYDPAQHLFVTPVAGSDDAGEEVFEAEFEGADADLVLADAVNSLVREVCLLSRPPFLARLCSDDPADL